MRSSIALMGTRDPDRPVAAAKRGAECAPSSGVCAFNMEKATPSTLFTNLPKPRYPFGSNTRKTMIRAPVIE